MINKSCSVIAAALAQSAINTRIFGVNHFQSSDVLSVQRLVVEETLIEKEPTKKSAMSTEPKIVTEETTL